jgi:hypothetical protein
MHLLRCLTMLPTLASTPQVSVLSVFQHFSPTNGSALLGDQFPFRNRIADIAAKLINIQSVQSTTNQTQVRLLFHAGTPHATIRSSQTRHKNTNLQKLKKSNHVHNTNPNNQPLQPQFRRSPSPKRRHDLRVVRSPPNRKHNVDGNATMLWIQ